MFGWCCEEQAVLKEELFVYRGNSNPRSVISVNEVNSAILKEQTHYQIYENSQFDSFLTECREGKREFRDGEFEVGKQVMVRRKGRKITWKRLKDFARGGEDNLLEERPVRDIVALSENDSYFLATLAAISREPRNIRDILCGDNGYSEWGIYRLNVCVHGKPKQVVIDDYLPVFEDNQIRTAFSKAERGSHWVLLLEKVYAKIRGGYDCISAGYAHEVLTTFTLAPCIYSIIPLSFDQKSQETVWEKLVEARQHRFPLVCGSRKRYTCEGIAMNQTYAFDSCWLDVKKEHKYRMIRLVNIPGFYSQSENCSIHFTANGECIELQLVQFMRNFQVIDVAHVRPQFNSYFYSYRSSSQYQFYLFDISNAHLSFYLTLQREKQEQGRLRIYLARVLENELTDYQLVQCKLEEVFSDVTLDCCDLPVGRYIVCLQCEVKSECFLRVYSESPIPFQQFKESPVKFLEHICFNNALSNRDKFFVMSKNSEDWYYTKVMFEEIGLGFLIVSLEQSSKAKCLAEYRREEVQGEGFCPVNKKEKLFSSMITGGQIEILIFEPSVASRREYLQFPPKSVRIKLVL